jgi:hypothetical protein
MESSKPSPRCKHSIQDVYDEIDKYFSEHPELNPIMRELCRSKYLKATEKYKGIWEEWSVTRLQAEALDELVDYINYQCFIRINKRDGKN